MARRILIVDQFSGITPYSLQQSPEPFEQLVQRVLNSDATGEWMGYHRPRVVEVDGGILLPMGTTAIEAGPNGIAQVWRTRWDSSG